MPKEWGDRVTQQVVDGVWWIRGQDDFLPDSHMYVIGMPGSEDFTLVDCGLMGKGEYKLEQIELCGVALGHVRRIVMTHTHLDHIGCLPEIKAAVPHAEVWIHRDEAGPIERGDERIVMGNSMFESMVRGMFALPKDAFATRVDRKLEDGDLLALGGLPFKVIHLPGHSAGGIGLLHEEHRLLLSGDTIYADWAIGRFDLVSADPAALKRSLELIADLSVDILLPCHNRIVTGGADPMIRQTVEQWGPMLK